MRAREHVQKPNGRFAVSVFVPGQALLKPESTEREPFGDYDDPDGRGHVVITHTYRYDPATQIKHITTYQRVGDDPAEVTWELKMRMFFPQELDALLTYNGFRIVDKFGDHEGKTPFGADSTQQLVVCALA